MHKNEILKWNDYGLYFSYILMLSMSFGAAFNFTEHFDIHFYLGSIPASISGGGLFYIQAWISYGLVPNVTNIKTAHFQYAICVLSTIFGIICFGSGLISGALWKLSIKHIAKGE